VASSIHGTGEAVASRGDVVTGGGAKLLLVEDDEAVRNLASRMLSDNGFDVLVAASAGEAEKIFAENRGEFDIIFSDVILPDDNGVILVERLCQKKPELGVVLASGYTGDELDRSQIEKKGFIFIQKPYTLADLLDTVGALVKK
jgi:two-component system cell cycle sensor histidine kinase/response regulator CckA